MRLPLLLVLSLLAVAGLAGCATSPDARTELGEADPEVASEVTDTSSDFSTRDIFGNRFRLAGRDLWVGSETDLILRPGEVILTFDDGPSSIHTPQILETLDEYGVSAVFFMVGTRARAYPEIAQAVALAGHAVGTHTMRHELLTQFDNATAMERIIEGEQAVAEALEPVHRSPAPFFRFPYLADTPILRTSLATGGLVIFGIDIDSLDYHSESSDHVLRRILSQIDRRGGGIVLFHDIHARTAQMLPELLEALKERGYQVVRARSQSRGLFGPPFLATANLAVPASQE